MEYLQLFGYTAYAYMWARMAASAARGAVDDAFYRAKLGSAAFYFQRLLPRTLGLEGSIRAGSTSLYSLEAELF